MFKVNIGCINNQCWFYLFSFFHNVCQHCLDNNYTYARGQTRWGVESYYVHDDERGPVYASWFEMCNRSEDFYVDTDNVPVGIVEVADNGYYAEVDDIVCCTDGAYRFPDDPEVVELADECPDTGERYALKCDAWEDGNGAWYSDHEEYVLIDGEKYREADCWQCHGTGLWHHDNEDYVEDDDGNKYDPEFFDRVSSDAEWGDEMLYDTRVDAELAPLDLLHYTRRELDFQEDTTPPTPNPTGWEHPGQRAEDVAELLAAAKAVLTNSFFALAA